MTSKFRWIRPGSIINTDAWSSYNRLHRLGYKHGVVNHSMNFVNPLDREIHTQSIERQWKILKTGLHRYGSG